MDMTKDALQYVVGLRKPEIIELGEDCYTDKEITRIPSALRARALEMSTLTSLVDYIKANVDSMSKKDAGTCYRPYDSTSYFLPERGS